MEATKLEATEKPGEPPKKRRRWPIAACALGIVSLCSWWYWPRGDARFVGKWKVGSIDYAGGTEPMSSFVQTLILRPNGGGDLYDYKNRHIRSLAWNVRDDVYCESAPATEQRSRPYSRTYTVDSITADTITLTVDSEVPTMTRIPE